MAQQTNYVHPKIKARENEHHNSGNPLRDMPITDLIDYVNGEAVGMSPQVRQLFTNILELIVENRSRITAMENEQ